MKGDKKIICLCALIVLLSLMATTGIAQTAFKSRFAPMHPFRLDGYNLPPDFCSTLKMDSADVDGDGDLDIFCAQDHQPSRLYINVGDRDGDGIVNFVNRPGRLPPDSLMIFDSEIEDVTGDGRPEIFAVRAKTYGYGAQRNFLYVNTGSGVFYDGSSNWAQDPPSSSQGIELCDLDGDLDLDIVVANGFVDAKLEAQPQYYLKERNRIYLNEGDTDDDGVPNFFDPYTDPDTRHNVWARLDNTQDIGCADINGDSLTDIVFANFADTNMIYLNLGDTDEDGIPNFAAATTSLLQAGEIYGDSTRDVCLADLDFDGDQDLFVMNTNSRNRLYLYYDSLGKFTEATETHLDPITFELQWDAEIADVNGDSLPDIFVAGDLPHLLFNDGTARFTDAGDYKLINTHFSSLDVELADIDGDGDPDALLGDLFEQNRFQLNDGTGDFTNDVTTVLAFPDADYSYDIALGDLDDDGDPDMYLANMHQEDRLYLQDETGCYLDVTATHLPDVTRETSFSVAFGRANPDIFPDILVTRNGNELFLFINNGDGSFRDASSQLPFLFPVAGGHTDSFFSDVDLDGDEDIFITTWSFFNLYPHRLFLNDGTGNFSDASGTHLPRDRFWAPCADYGDVNGNGRPDIAIASNGIGRATALYVNTGGGVFADSSANLGPDNPANISNNLVRFGDVDGDLDLDLFVGNAAGSGDRHRNQLYINDGKGRYTNETGLRLPDDRYYNPLDCFFFDIGDDGDQDLVIANYLLGYEHQPFNILQVYINNGNGFFFDETSSYVRKNSVTGEMHLCLDGGDIDGDGDIDILAGTDGQTRLYFNHTTLPAGSSGRRKTPQRADPATFRMK